MIDRTFGSVTQGDGPRTRPVYFGAQGEHLFGWYHTPVGPPRDAAVVICAPFGVEAIFSHRALRHLAQRLARDGFPVLRYDHHDTGDSDGPGTSPGRVAAWLTGVRTALDMARELSGAPMRALVGLRLGATLGAIAVAGGTAETDKSGRTVSMALWAPIVSGRRYVRELKAFSQVGGAPSSGAVGGFYVAPDTMTAIEEIDLTKLERPPASRVLFVPRDDLPDDGALAAHFASLGAAVETIAVAGYARAMVEPHNTEVPDLAIDAIVSWLARAHPRLERPSVTGAATEPPDAIVVDVVAPDRSAVQVTERPVFLDAEQRLFGILTEPVTTPKRGTAIVLANAGAVYRIGPNRLYVSMAREWAALGFPVLRMDIGGIGDSLPARSAEENDTYPRAAVSDIVTAIDALRARGSQRFVVAGLCSGAHAAFHVGLERADTPGLAGLMLINPIVFYWKPGDALDVSAWQNYLEARRIRMQVLTQTGWGRVMRGQVHVGAAVRTFVRRGATLASAAVGRMRARFNPHAAEDLARDLLAITAGPLDLFMAFSEGDPGLDQLSLHARHALKTLGERPNFTLTTISSADHTFTQIDVQQRLRAILVEHLTKSFS